MSIRKSPRLAMYAEKAPSPPGLRRSPRLEAKAPDTRIAEAKAAAIAEQTQRAETAAARVEARHMLEGRNVLDPLFCQAEGINKFLKDLYIKLGLFQHCKDVFLPVNELDPLGSVLIKINGDYYWLSGFTILNLEREHIGDIGLPRQECVTFFDSVSDDDYEVYKN